MQIQQDNFIQRLLKSEASGKRVPGIAGKRTRYLKKLTDARLVKYVRRGNRKAFDVLVLRHEPKLKQILRGCLFDKSLVDDVAQDVWEMVVPRLRSRGYHENGHFYGWLSTLAFRKAMKVNRQKMYDPEMIRYVAEVHDVVYDPWESDHTDFISDEAQKVIETFKEEEKRIIKMRIEENLSFEEIARKTGLNRNSVKSSHFRSMKKVREILTQRRYKRSGIRTL